MTKPKKSAAKRKSTTKPLVSPPRPTPSPRVKRQREKGEGSVAFFILTLITAAVLAGFVGFKNHTPRGVMPPPAVTETTPTSDCMVRKAEYESHGIYGGECP